MRGVASCPDVGRGLDWAFEWGRVVLDATVAADPPEGDTPGGADDDGVVPNT